MIGIIRYESHDVDDRGDGADKSGEAKVHL